MLERSEYIYSIPDGLTGEKNQDNIVPFINYKEAAPKRCLEMLLKKHRGEHFQSEVIMVSPEKPKIPNLHKKLNEAKILLMTDGGLVPKEILKNFLQQTQKYVWRTVFRAVRH